MEDIENGVSIPILRVGVQPKKSKERVSMFIVSIPILRVGVQHNTTVKVGKFPGFQFPYCAWEFNQSTTKKVVAIIKFQFPYCAWEFNMNSHGYKKIFIKFQFPYCTWEFKMVTLSPGCDTTSFNSHTARGSSKNEDREPYTPRTVSIPILRVGVQRIRRRALPQSQGFQFPYCAWEFNT